MPLKKKYIQVVAALIEYKKYLLIAKRPFRDLLRKNLWEFPGGKVEKDESLKQALKREIEEELNFTITEEMFFLKKVKYSYPDIDIELYGFLIKTEREIKISENTKFVLPHKIKKNILTAADYYLLEEYQTLCTKQ